MSESERTERETAAIKAAGLFYNKVVNRLGVGDSATYRGGYQPVELGAIGIIAALILIDSWQTDRHDRTNGILESIRDFGIEQERNGGRG